MKDKTIQFKIDYMLENGFKLHKCPHRNIHTLDFNGYEWTFDNVLNHKLKDIKQAIDIYNREVRKL